MGTRCWTPEIIRTGAVCYTTVPEWRRGGGQIANRSVYSKGGGQGVLLKEPEAPALLALLLGLAALLLALRLALLLRLLLAAVGLAVAAVRLAVVAGHLIPGGVIFVAGGSPKLEQPRPAPG